MKYKFIPTTKEHVQFIIDNLSEVHRKEIESLTNLPIKDVVTATVDNSDEAWTGLVYDIPVGIFGVKRESILSDVGNPWLLGTEELFNHKKSLLFKAVKITLNHWGKQYPVLENYIPASFTQAISWLRRLGFEVEKVNKNLYRFRMRS